MRTFEAMLPPGWAQVDLTSPVAESVDTIVGGMLEGLPREAADPARQHLTEQLRRAMTGLAGDGAVVAYLPVDDAMTSPVRPFIAVRPVSFEIGGATVEPLDYLVAMMTQEGVSLIEPIDMVGIKRVTDSSNAGRLATALEDVPQELVEQADRTQLGSAVAAGQRTRHLQYIIGVPDAADYWMSVEASVSAPGGADADEALDAVEEFIDAWVGTIRWTEEPRG